MTTAWLSHISLCLNQLLVAVASGHYMAAVLQKNPYFTISVLAEDHEAHVLFAAEVISGECFEKRQWYIGQRSFSD